MTVQSIAQKVLDIDGLWRGDPEAALSKQSALREAVLKFIASGDCPDPAAFAAASLGSDA